MTSPPGAEVFGALDDEERAALAAWADDGDGPDDFSDRVVAAFMAERVGAAAGDDAEVEAAAVRTSARTGEGRVVRVVGLCAAIAAAAAVMLMVRVLPRSADAEATDTAVAAGVGVSGEPAAEATVGGAAAERVDLMALGADAAAVLAVHCSPCHDAEDPEAKPEALRVFDIRQPQWWITMSDAQLEEARTRVQELGAASEDERRTVTAFVEARQRATPHAG
jgi:hypothetical protein